MKPTELKASMSRSLDEHEQTVQVTLGHRDTASMAKGDGRTELRSGSRRTIYAVL